MTRQEYTKRVLDALRHVTLSEYDAIRNEISGHIEDHMEALLDCGLTEKEAEARTLAAMGDPEEIGRALNKQYSYGWLLVSRALAILIALSIFASCFSGLTLIHRVSENVCARVDPVSQLAETYRKQLLQELDIKLEIGSDVLYIYGTGIDENGYMDVYWVKYSRNILGAAGNWGVTFVDRLGRDVRKGGGSSSSSGVSYFRERLEIPRGTAYVKAVVERYGERTEAEVPLVWEVTE